MNIRDSKYVYEFFTEQLNRLLKSNKMTQQELAHKLDISKQSVSNYCSGKYFPEISRLIDIANIFDVSVDYLLGLSELSKPNADISTAEKTTGLKASVIKELYRYSENTKRNRETLKKEKLRISTENKKMIASKERLTGKAIRGQKSEVYLSTADCAVLTKQEYTETLSDFLSKNFDKFMIYLNEYINNSNLYNKKSAIFSALMDYTFIKDQGTFYYQSKSNIQSFFSLLDQINGDLLKELKELKRSASISRMELENTIKETLSSYMSRDLYMTEYNLKEFNTNAIKNAIKDFGRVNTLYPLWLFYMNEKTIPYAIEVHLEEDIKANMKKFLLAKKEAIKILKDYIFANVSTTELAVSVQKKENKDWLLSDEEAFIENFNKNYNKSISYLENVMLMYMSEKSITEFNRTLIDKFDNTPKPITEQTGRMILNSLYEEVYNNIKKKG